MKRKIRAILSKVNFLLDRDPKVIKYENINYRDYIPKSYNAVFILSADFELAWAWRYAKAAQGQKQKAIYLARRARENIPKILELCDEYNIPITWATVGHLFLESCSKNGNLAHPQLDRLSYHENQYWKFDRGDWFEDDPCTDWKKSPEWYAPDLIRMILDAKTEHEIACHTFSHIDCRDEICSPQVFSSEIKQCHKLMKKHGIELKSFVHPGHTIGNLDILGKLGFTSFRTNYDNILGYPQKHSNGLWEIQSTAELTYRKEWSINYHVWRYKTIVDRAVKYRRLCQFWFHPSCDKKVVDLILPGFFEYLEYLKNKRRILISTTGKYIDYLQGKNQ